MGGRKPPFRQNRFFPGLQVLFMEARIFNIQKYSLHDGPGIRTLVFFQGCPLRCLWCANPEGQTAKSKIMINHSLCRSCGACLAACPERLHSLAGGRHELDQARCGQCGRCVEACPERALALCGKNMAIADLMAVILEDKTFYEVSGGGVTIGGGEPLAQPQALRQLLEQCRAAGIATALETCGQAPREALEEIAPLVDLFLYDIKHMDSARHQELTGVGNEQILANLQWLLQKGFPLRVRMPLVPGLNADAREIAARRDFLAPFAAQKNFLGVDLLPYHRLGAHKYAQLGQQYGLPDQQTASDAELADWQNILEEAGIKTRVVRH